MRSFLKMLINKERQLKILERIEALVKSMRLAEKVLWYSAFFVFAISTVAILQGVNKYFLEGVPAYGGNLTEGIVGTPRFVNPLLATSDADKDLVSLVYSGLMKKTREGTFIPDLAESYTVSEDGLTYTFSLRKDALWSDGKTVTTNDVVFTILKAQDPDLKSSERTDWEGVSVKKNGNQEITFTLSQPFSSFIENTILGILPEHLWGNVGTDEFPFSQWNIEPVGSGPFIVKNVKRNGSGVPTSFELISNEKYALGEPYISNLNIRFFPSEEATILAYKGGAIQSISGLSPINAKEFENSSALRRAPLTRSFGVFLNQNQNEALIDKGARQALSAAIDKKLIIDSALSGYGTVTDSPLPPNARDTGVQAGGEDMAPKEKAIKILADSGWKKDDTTGLWQKKINGQNRNLSVSLSTSNVSELVETARIIESAWKDIGVDVNTRIFEISDLNQNIIRPRKYEALLFGTIITNDSDLYAFWHSSQRNDPGLNIAMYTNSKTDSALETLRKTADKEAREKGLEIFKGEISKDVPAIFLYAPDFIYIIPDEIKNVDIGPISATSDRFINIHEWYLKTNSVWKIFVKKDSEE